jgi:hypothetical protein
LPVCQEALLVRRLLLFRLVLMQRRPDPVQPPRRLRMSLLSMLHPEE